MIKISIDAMGGDHGPSVVIPALARVAKRRTDVSFIVYGRTDAVRPELDKFPALAPIVQFVHCDVSVKMGDKPSQALRQGRWKSSMWRAIEATKTGDADACVSAGNTGALMAISRFVLKTLPGVDRPAIATVLPSMKGHTYVLDLGANVDCTAEHLLQFGVMGSSLVAAIEHKERPSVGLLNIGEEAIKGNDVVKEAGELLRASGLNFYGNVEGDDIYEGTVDVVVCDGFVGNVALKTSEGLAQMLGAFLKQEFSRSPLTKLMAVVALPVLKRFKKRVDHRLYNGAPLLGLRGVVLKSHGSADAVAFGNALSRAADAASNRLIERISERMANMNEVKA